MNLLNKLAKPDVKENFPLDASALRERIAWMMDLMTGVRGYQFLLKPDIAIVLHKDYDVDITNDAFALKDRQNVIGLVYLKDIGCYQEFVTMQNDETLRKGPLGPMTSNYLADQAARQLLGLTKESGA